MQTAIFIILSTLKSGKSIEYKPGENKGYRTADDVHKDNILIRKLQKGNMYDVISIKEHK